MNNYNCLFDILIDYDNDSSVTNKKCYSHNLTPDVL